MFTVRFIRTGRPGNINRECKGSFKLTFNSLEELVRYICKSRKSVWFLNLRADIGRENIKIIDKKYRSIINRKILSK